MIKTAGILFIYTLLIPIMAFFLSAINISTVDAQYYFFLTIMFLPEIGFLFKKKFREWLKDGIEDNDHKFQKEDFAALMTHYSTLWCIRLFVIFGLRETFYGIVVREIYVFATLAGGFGIEVVSFFIRRGEKKPNNE